MDTNLRNTDRSQLPRRLLLLLTARTYRADAFISAAKNLNVEVICATDVPIKLAEYWNNPLGLEYSNTDKSVQAIVDYVASNPIGAILAVDDSGTKVAALASQALGLPHNSPTAAEAARDKYLMRQLLSNGGVPSPQASRYTFDPLYNRERIHLLSTEISYPSVIKPLNLNGSRGVIRVNNPQEFSTAAAKLFAMLRPKYSPDMAIPFIVEAYVPGVEVALEGILDDGHLHLLALFDKPDPLNGPYFEETIYVTPSRLPDRIQSKILTSTVMAAQVLGLSEGPIHAELRLDKEKPYIIELAGRSIGGLCAKTLKFGLEDSLESIIIRQALGLEFINLRRHHESSGVMMIPIPEAGLLKSVGGCELAAATPLVEEIEITAKINNLITPLPDGDSYLGFIFARGETPAAVEGALREAHNQLTFNIAPQLPMLTVSL